MSGNELEEKRREAIHQLCVAQAQSIMSVEQFEQRLALVREAPTPAAIQQLIADVQVGNGEWEAGSGIALAEGQPREVSLESYAAPSEVPQRLRMTAIFATTKKRGSGWYPTRSRPR